MKKATLSEHLSRDELEQSISAFSDVDWVRIKKVGQIYAFYPVEADELVQEALCRALAGTRKCPRNVTVLIFLLNTIRGIAHDEHNKKEHKRKEVSVHSGESDQNIDAITPRSLEPTGEQTLISKEQFQNTEARLLELFEGDEIAQLIVFGDMEGENGQELRHATGLSQTEFNSKRRFIKRKLNRAIEKGFLL